MAKKFSVIFVLGVIVLLLLVSCQRAASQSPQGSLATPTGGSRCHEDPSDRHRPGSNDRDNHDVADDDSCRPNTGGFNSFSSYLESHFDTIWHPRFRHSPHRSCLHPATRHNTYYHRVHSHTRQTRNIHAHAGRISILHCPALQCQPAGTFICQRAERVTALAAGRGLEHSAKRQSLCGSTCASFSSGCLYSLVIQ